MIREPLCVSCKHFSKPDGDGFKCSAYPEGIPHKIVTSVVDHKKPYKGDNGIQFEPDKKTSNINR